MANTNATATLEHGTSRLLALPSELIHSILSYLSPHDLAFVTATCHLLREHGLSDLHWRALVQDQVPGCQIRRSYPCSTFRDLYAAHDRVWFLPKFKIWFSDREMVGKMVLLRYDQRRGCIEGLQMVAVTEPTTFERWEETDSNVIIHIFRPTVKLHLENPILQFNVGDATSAGDRPSLGHRFGQDIPMVLPDRAQNMRSNFILTKPLDQVGASQRLLGDYPYGHIWPPPTIPAHDHVSGVAHGTSDDDDRPTHRSQVSDQTFRIRRWVQMGGWLNDFSVHMGDSTSTYSTLDPVLYTPTPTKPWRGIWVGDYVGHGCEFLLIHQPDDPPATDAELGLVRSQYETEEQWEQRRLEARIYRGRLEAIKLTGDANIPRGEYTFIADNLGPDGLVGIAEKQPFTGARMVHSTGHVAGTGFSEGTFQVLLLLTALNQVLTRGEQISSLRASLFSSVQTNWRSIGLNSGSSTFLNGSISTVFSTRRLLYRILRDSRRVFVRMHIFGRSLTAHHMGSDSSRIMRMTRGIRSMNQHSALIHNIYVATQAVVCIDSS